MLGVSIAENAVRVLAHVAGIPGVNVAKLLDEHATRPQTTKAKRWWQDDRDKPGQLVIVDEAGMASRQTIDGIRRLAPAAGAKILLVGYDEQLESPAGGGIFELAAHQPDGCSWAWSAASSGPGRRPPACGCGPGM